MTARRTVPTLSLFTILLLPTPQVPGGREQNPLLLMREEVFTATIREVQDGDSIVVRDIREYVAVHLDGMDAPELSQPFGPEAREFLSDLAKLQEVTVRVIRRGRLGEEAIARVELKGSDISLTLLRNGMAWYCGRHADDRELMNAEKTARDERKGVWSSANPTPPWKYRGTTACWKERAS